MGKGWFEKILSTGDGSAGEISAGLDRDEGGPPAAAAKGVAGWPANKSAAPMGLVSEGDVNCVVGIDASVVDVRAASCGGCEAGKGGCASACGGADDPSRGVADAGARGGDVGKADDITAPHTRNKEEQVTNAENIRSHSRSTRIYSS